MVSSRWCKGRFFHDLLPETKLDQGGSASNTQQAVSPIQHLLEIAHVNDNAVSVLKDGRIGRALHIFSDALVHARKFREPDANSVQSRNLTFSEVIVSATRTSETIDGGTGSQHYLVPINCGDESSIFSKAILLCPSHLQASLNTLLDVLQFHMGLCRHIQGLESSSVPRRLALLNLATKRYKEVQDKGLVRAAAYCNLVSSGGVIFLQGFLDAYHALENSDEMAEFCNCIAYVAHAA